MCLCVCVGGGGGGGGDIWVTRFNGSLTPNPKGNLHITYVCTYVCTYVIVVSCLGVLQQP